MGMFEGLIKLPFAVVHDTLTMGGELTGQKSAVKDAVEHITGTDTRSELEKDIELLRKLDDIKRR